MAELICAGVEMFDLAGRPQIFEESWRQFLNRKAQAVRAGNYTGVLSGMAPQGAEE